MKYLGRLLVLAAIAFALPVGRAQAQNHGVTLTWAASPSAAGCTSPCTYGYNVFEGAGSGLESTTPFNAAPVSGVAFTDNGSTMNAYLGTTRCYTVQFQEVVSGLTLSSGPSTGRAFRFLGAGGSGEFVGCAALGTNSKC